MVEILLTVIYIQFLFPWSSFPRNLILYPYFRFCFLDPVFPRNLIFDSYFRLGFLDPVSPTTWSLIPISGSVSLIQFLLKTDLWSFSGWFPWSSFPKKPGLWSLFQVFSVSLIRFSKDLTLFQVLFHWSSFSKNWSLNLFRFCFFDPVSQRNLVSNPFFRFFFLFDPVQNLNLNLYSGSASLIQFPQGTWTLISISGSASLIHFLQGTWSLIPISGSVSLIQYLLRTWLLISFLRCGAEEFPF